jgi:hypothetical protein
MVAARRSVSFLSLFELLSRTFVSKVASGGGGRVKLAWFLQVPAGVGVPGVALVGREGSLGRSRWVFICLCYCPMLVIQGQMAEWSKAAHSSCVLRAWVRIPLWSNLLSFRCCPALILAFNDEARQSSRGLAEGSYPPIWHTFTYANCFHSGRAGSHLSLPGSG